MKKVIGICVLLGMLSVAAQVQATPRYWKSVGGPGQDGLFTNGANWADSMTTAPQNGDVAYILNGAPWGAPTAACTFQSSFVNLEALRVGDTTVGGFTDVAVMNMVSGMLSTSAYDAFVGTGAGAKGVLNMSGGTITSTSGYFVVGQAGGNGTLNMTGGTINCANLWVSNQANSFGRIHLDGGTINFSNSISIQGNNDAGNKTIASGNGVIDITGGKIVIQKNEDLTWLADYLKSIGAMTAYDGAGSFVSTRDSVTGFTTITAVVPEPATMTLLVCGVFGLLKRKRS
ncbi:MAG: hypothetical protein A2Y07_04415 [Planctomycetes bacterium GWF2_50_10]|nr:MAG: hypothetical protein A2Y07_04415 [Planctomycetes bacterium GWF2_50_10]